MRWASALARRNADIAAIGLGPDALLRQAALVGRAAKGAWDLARARFDPCPGAVIGFLIGGGMNGADAMQVASLCREQGFRPHVYDLAADRERCGGAFVAYGMALRNGIPLISIDPCSEEEVRTQILSLSADMWFDGMLGVGLSRELGGAYAAAANALPPSRTVALDLPTGLCADTGRVLGTAVRAALTVAFGRPCPGHFLSEGPDRCGHLEVVDIGLPPDVWNEDACGELLDPSWLVGRLRPRPRSAHKGTAGRTVLLSGSIEYPGAALLGAEGALRGGAGYVEVLGPAELRTALSCRLPEAVVRVRPELPASQHPPLPFDRALVAGPGLGRDATAAAWTRWALDHPGPLILDADSLRLLASSPDAPARLAARTHPAVLTPHLGEARDLARAVSVPSGSDDLTFARAIAQAWGAVVVLKGATTVVAHPDGRAALHAFGHSGMATAGMGDALAGLLGARLAEHPQDPFEVACLAVSLHGRAAHLGAHAVGGRRGLRVTDLLLALPRALEEAEEPSVEHAPYGFGSMR